MTKSLSQSLVAPAPVRTAGRVAAAALAQLERLETIEQAYDAWRELKLEHAAFLLRCATERRRLEQQGSFLVGSVRAAAQLEQQAPVTPAAEGAEALARSGQGALEQYLREAEQKIARAREALEAELASESRIFEEALEKIRTETQERVRRVLEGAPPRMRLLLRPIANGRTILHVERVSPDDAVLLLYALTGRIPSRYGYLFDDSTNDVTQAPEPLYPDEGVTDDKVRCDPPALRNFLGSAGRVLPVKGFIPVFIPEPGGGEAFYRLLQRGPVMEVERLDGDGFRCLLQQVEGERFAGHLLRLKLEGRLDLELEAG